MKKFKLVPQVKQVEEIEEIACNQCGKDLGKDEWNYDGGLFCPVFNWCSKYDDVVMQVHVCTECWDGLCDNMMCDPRPTEEEEE